MARRVTNKAGVCKCGHETRYWHDPETGQCMYGRAWKGHRASTTGSCSCVRKTKGKKTVKTKTTTQTVTVDGVRVLSALDQIIAGLTTLREEVARAKKKGGLFTSLITDVEKNGPLTETILAPAVSPQRVPRGTAVTDIYAGPAAVPPDDANPDDMSRMVRTMLTALAQHPHGLTKAQILIHTEYRVSGSTTQAFATLTRTGWAISHAPNALKITPVGLAALGPFDKLPTGEKFRAHLLNGSKLKTMDKKILSVVCDSYPAPIAKGDVLDIARYATSGSTTESFARLVRFGYVRSAGANRLRASEELFGS